jgi:DNA-binding response OmpR family regulator
MRVLVVEDFEVLARSIATGLRREGMAVDVVLDGTDALSHLAVTRYDVIVLDRDLPGVHGDDICRRLVTDGADSRVLMLTASSTVKDRVDGLGLGADDYLPKPFDFAELTARVRALGRRSTPPVPPTLAYQDISLDPARRAVSRAGRRLELSPRSSRCSNACSPRPALCSLPRNCLNESGTRRLTRSPARSSTPCTACEPSSATHPSFTPSARAATA